MRRLDLIARALLLVAAVATSAGTSLAQDTMPSGHPPVDDSNPHARAGNSEAMPGVFQPPEDTEAPDPTLPPGTIVVELRDADDHPVPNETVTLGAMTNSIAKGDSRKHFQQTTDAGGRTTFSGLQTASNVAYRVSSGYQGGSFAASPFQLKQGGTMRVVLHVYAVTRDIRDARVVCEATVASEMRDDRIHVEEVFTIYNLGRTAWAPLGVTLPLPEGYTAFSTQASMSDQGVDDAVGSAKLRGTFPPGRHTVDFRWQLPWSGDKDVDFDVGMPPHAAIVRVMMPAATGVRLAPEGFPPAEIRHDGQGQSFLVTERRMRPDEGPLTALRVGIHDLPTAGPGRLVATLLASCGVAIGLAFSVTSARGRARRASSPSQGDREALLAELADLEQAHADGDVGPRTYERARKEILESLARLLLQARAT
jgi:hypothetical protein